MSLHHVDDEVVTLRRVRALLQPLGVLCVLERAKPTSVRWADDLGRPGLGDRLDEAWRRRSDTSRAHLPGALNAEIYPEMLAAAGLQVVSQRTMACVVRPPDNESAGRFVTNLVERTVTELEGHAERSRPHRRAHVPRSAPSVLPERPRGHRGPHESEALPRRPVVTNRHRPKSASSSRSCSLHVPEVGSSLPGAGVRANTRSGRWCKLQAVHRLDEARARKTARATSLKSHTVSVARSAPTSERRSAIRRMRSDPTPDRRASSSTPIWSSSRIASARVNGVGARRWSVASV